jgi:hypothetical protein
MHSNVLQLEPMLKCIQICNVQLNTQGNLWSNVQMWSNSTFSSVGAVVVVVSTPELRLYVDSCSYARKSAHTHPTLSNAAQRLYLGAGARAQRVPAHVPKCSSSWPVHAWRIKLRGRLRTLSMPGTDVALTNELVGNGGARCLEMCSSGNSAGVAARILSMESVDMCRW